jgi:hypothetical protein
MMKGLDSDGPILLVGIIAFFAGYATGWCDRMKPQARRYWQGFAELMEWFTK